MKEQTLPAPTSIATPTRDQAPRWVPETRFGQWFLGTNVWARYVVKVAMDDFVRLLPSPLPRPRRILDAGSGPGVSVPMLDAAFHPEEIVAIDANPAEVERTRLQAARCACRTEVRRGDAAHLPFADGSFDLILCHQLLHHVVPQKEVLREFHRVLAPGGVLLVAESCRSFILTAPVRLLFRHPNHVQRTAEGYQQLVREAGFEFEAKHVLTATPFWSQTDWGLRERLGWRRAADAEPTELTMVAFKPAARL